MGRNQNFVLFLIRHLGAVRNLDAHRVLSQRLSLIRLFVIRNWYGLPSILFGCLNFRLILLLTEGNDVLAHHLDGVRFLQNVIRTSNKRQKIQIWMRILIGVTIESSEDDKIITDQIG